MIKKYLGRFIYLVLITFGITQYTKASTPGFIVTAKGDTIRGEISYIDLILTTNNISFKETGATKWQKLKPADINYFELNNKSHTAYRTYRGLITMDRTAVDVLHNERDTVTKRDTIFLRVIQTGINATLYLYQDSYKERYFISTTVDPPHELLFKRYFGYNPINAFAHKTIYEPTYRLQLMDISNYYDTTDEEFFRLIGESEYEKRPLINLVKKINHLKPN